MIRTFECFKAGTHTDMRGVPVTCSREGLRTIAGTFSPLLRPAPLVIGHPSDDLPAKGEMLALFASGDSLLCIADVENELLNAVRAKQFSSVSLSFYLPDHKDNPCPGVLYPKHCGFLGNTKPAVEGMQALAFSDGFAEACFAQAGFGDESFPDAQDQIYFAAVEFQRATGGCDFSFAAANVERAARILTMRNRT
jgi:hypothetical protein